MQSAQHTKPLLLLQGLFACCYTIINYSLVGLNHYFTLDHLPPLEVMSHFVISSILACLCICLAHHCSERFRFYHIIHGAFFLCVLGTAMMTQPWHATFGLSCVIVGIHAAIISLFCQLSHNIQSQSKHQRHKIFMIQYGMMNAGIFLGYLVTNPEYYPYSPMLIVLILLLPAWAWMLRYRPITIEWRPVILLTILILFTNILMHSHHFITTQPLLLVILCVLGYTYRYFPRQERRQSFLIMLTGAFVFWVCYQPSQSIILLLNKSNRILLPFDPVPTSTATIMVLLPLMIHLYQRFQPSFLSSWLIALFALGLNDVFLLIATTHDHYAWLMLALFCRSAAELSLVPLCYAFIPHVVTKSWHSILIIFWLLMPIITYSLTQYSTHLLSMAHNTMAPYTLGCLIILILFLTYTCFQARDYLREMIEPNS